jgi:hypothetical protein
MSAATTPGGFRRHPLHRRGISSAIFAVFCKEFVNSLGPGDQRDDGVLEITLKGFFSKNPETILYFERSHSGWRERTGFRLSLE